MIKQRPTFWGLNLLLFTCSISFAHELVKEDFNGQENQPLNGKKPNLYEGSKKVTWESESNEPLNPSDARANGSLSGPDSQIASLELPFTLEDGHLYTITAKVSLLNEDDSSQWCGLMLNTAVSMVNPLAHDIAGVFLRRNGRAFVTVNSFGKYPPLGKEIFELTEQALEIQIDTRQTQWTATFSVGPKSNLEGSVTMDMEPYSDAIYLGIGKSKDSEAKFNSLTVTRTE